MRGGTSRPGRCGVQTRSVLWYWALAVMLGVTRVCAQSLSLLSEPVPPQSLAGAIDSYAQLTGLQIIYFSDIVRGQVSKGVPAGLAPAAALTRLLDGSGLSFEFLNEHAVRIVAAPVQPKAQTAVPIERIPSMLPTTLEEVVVTATRRSEYASQVPISMGVWTQDDMTSSGVKDIAGLADLTPGVEFDSYPDYGPGIETNIAIRGINARVAQSGVIRVGDVAQKLRR